MVILAHDVIDSCGQCFAGALINKLDMEQEVVYDFAERSTNREVFLMRTQVELQTKRVVDMFDTSIKGKQGK